MYIVKVDLPTGVAYFTGKKKVVQGEEFPGLTDELSLAKQYELEEEAQKYCKMLVRRYDMDFYYSFEETVQGATEEDSALEASLEVPSESMEATCDTTSD